jgi:amidohydrolase
MKIKELAKKYKQYAIDMRREFHMHPETGWNEINTSRRIKEEMDKMGIPYVSTAKTGVIATIAGKKDGKTVALRADMDALEVQEKNDVEYKSQNEGVSHACGHDGHMAMLLGAAKVLNDIKDDLNGTVKLIFQPAEEAMGGATSIIEDGGLEGVDNIFAIHLLGPLPLGLVSVGKGPRMSSADYFSINVTGKGGHGGMPDQGVDAIVAASAIVMNLQSIVSREISPKDPVVISVGKFNAGSRFNVIAGSAQLEGTTRCFRTDLGERLPLIMERIITNTAKVYRAEAKLEYVKGVIPTVNEETSAERAEKMIANTYGKDVLFELPPTTGAEDFSYYLEKVPGVYIFLGAGNEEKGIMQVNHHEEFNIDEDALEIGTVLNVQYALDFLNE